MDKKTAFIDLEVGDEVKGSEHIDPSLQRFLGVRGKVVDIRGPRIRVKFQGDLFPSREMYEYELLKIPSGV